MPAMAARNWLTTCSRCALQGLHTVRRLCSCPFRTGTLCRVCLRQRVGASGVAEKGGDRARPLRCLHGKEWAATEAAASAPSSSKATAYKVRTGRSEHLFGPHRARKQAARGAAWPIVRWRVSSTNALTAALRPHNQSLPDASFIMLLPGRVHVYVHVCTCTAGL